MYAIKVFTSKFIQKKKVINNQIIIINKHLNKA